jgi:hypothetical protein
MNLKLWSIVRQGAGLLQKLVNSLSINVTDILVRQKQITLGKPPKEFVINSPLTPSQIKEVVYENSLEDIRIGPLFQELLTYLGSFIRAESRLFEGVIRVRLSFVLDAMKEEIARETGDADYAFEHMMRLSPYQMRSLLRNVLSARVRTQFLMILLFFLFSNSFFF